MVDPEIPSRVVHLRLRGANGEIEPSDVALVSGSLGERQLRDLERGTPSQALSERLLPLTVYAEGGDLWALPQAAFADGTFTFAAPKLGIVKELEVSPEAEPFLIRAFPPAGQTTAKGVAVYCGLGTSTSILESAQLLPAGPAGAFRDGLRDGDGSGCVRFEPEHRPDEGVAQPPLRAAGALLDPSPIALGPVVPPAPLTCSDLEVQVGRACLLVDDDRLALRTPLEASLWGISINDGAARVVATSGAFPITITGLTPASTQAIRADVVSLTRAIEHHELEVTTSAAHPHLVINEVYANSVGAEPDQEWVELFNSGTVPVSLEDFVLRDVGGETALPEGIALAPGAFALIVNEGFDETPSYDVPPAPGAQLVRVAKLGKNGLSNSGEPLELVYLGGQTEDAFPPTPKPLAGVSVGRIHPDVVPGDDTGFVRFETPTPGSANPAAPDVEE